MKSSLPSTLPQPARRPTERCEARHRTPAPKEKLPPHDLNVEAHVLGSCIEWPDECMPAALNVLGAQTFYDRRHQAIFARLAKMYRASAKIDALTLHTALTLGKDLEDEGGAAYASTLPNLPSSPANFPVHVKTLRDYAARRQAAEIAQELQWQLEQHPEHAQTITQKGITSLQAVEKMFGAEDEAAALADAAEMVAKPGEFPPEIIAGLLHQGSKGVLSGGSKSCKTWTLLDMAVSVSHGQDWLGFHTRKSKVLYVNLEIQPPFFAERIRSILKARGISCERGQLRVLNLRGQCGDFATVYPRIVERARLEEFALIVLDPIYKLYGDTDENSAGDVAQLLNHLDRLATTTGAAVVFGAHYTKGNQAGKESIDRISGSGVFARDPDSILSMTKHEEDGALTIEATLRNLAPVAPFVVRWEFPLMLRDPSLDPTRLKQPKGRKSAHKPDDLLALLPPLGLKTGDWCAAADKEEGISRRTFFNLKKRLVGAGQVRMDKLTERWMRNECPRAVQ